MLMFLFSVFSCYPAERTEVWLSMRVGDQTWNFRIAYIQALLILYPNVQAYRLTQSFTLVLHVSITCLIRLQPNWEPWPAPPTACAGHDWFR